ncbi:helix-turn-helix transcriptional regulator [Paenibacillus sp. OV219]|uniref:ArsR/SmtB family transcription factor n=1 Tax=Paenibacillus sp. OV219 TaxID=1884377 RepID=UPI0008D13737|nr:metalloregulator ArsR/SmtB family transcription factor [Paenibacillus sp. OV219]SEP00244.1 transcriptional regulator, ArsR family [Paenibacillus sp. OV219]
MDNLFKALADSSRRQLLDELFIHNGQTLTELCEHLDMTRQSITKHLSILEEAQLVVTERQGRNKLHYLNAAPLGDIYDRWISKFDQHRVNILQQLKRNLEEDHDQSHDNN